MPLYEVTYKQTEYYTMKIEAESEEEAEEKAGVIVDSQDDLFHYHSDSVGYFIVYEVE